MNTLSDKDLKRVTGGGINWGLWTAVGGFASFVMGLVDGFIHTKKCNS